MGAQSILPAVLVVAASTAAFAGGWKAARGTHERVAVIDLGPSDPATRQELAQAVVAAGLEPVIGDGVDDALAGESIDRDAALLAAALDDAHRAFGEQHCSDATKAAQNAIAIGAARQ